VEVVKATQADLDYILGWLEREHKEEGGGFWCNKRLIISALETDELTVIREDGKAVAFQVGNRAPEITSVRKDRQGQGYGTALFKAGLRRAIDEGLNVLNITCAPASSWAFWRRFGFEAIGPVHAWGEVKARRILERRHELPEGEPADVQIAFYPKEVTYGRDEPVEPYAVHRPQAVRLSDGTIALEQRVIGMKPDGIWGDLVIRIIVDGEERCFCKAKYDEAEAAGVIRNRLDGTYYLDQIAA
jgi:GNAT superfamily N-acetyltransferase